MINLSGANAANGEGASDIQARQAGADVATDTTNGAAIDVGNRFQYSSSLLNYRDMQRRQVEFIKKRVLLLEKGLAAEYQKEYFVSCSICFFFVEKHPVYDNLTKCWPTS